MFLGRGKTECAVTALTVIFCVISADSGASYTARTWGKTLLISRDGHLRPVTSAHEAIEVLFFDWPRWDGPAYFSTFDACGRAERGESTEKLARSAFILAAIEAGLYFEMQA
jgi:hypothetical protein